MTAIEPIRMDKISALSSKSSNQIPQARSAKASAPSASEMETSIGTERLNYQVGTVLHAKATPATTASADTKNDQLSFSELQEQILQMNDLFQKHVNKRLSFFVDDESGKQGVRVIDIETEEIIKQIPPEEVLELAKRLREQLGVLLDKFI